MDYKKAIEIIKFYQPRLRKNGLDDLANAIDTVITNLRIKY